MSEEQRPSAECHLEFTELPGVRIQGYDEGIEERAGEGAAAALLQTMPGIGPCRSLLLVREISPIQRFPKAKRSDLCSRAIRYVLAGQGTETRFSHPLPGLRPSGPTRSTKMFPSSKYSTIEIFDDR